MVLKLIWNNNNKKKSRINQEMVNTTFLPGTMSRLMNWIRSMGGDTSGSKTRCSRRIRSIRRRRRRRRKQDCG